MERYLVLDNLNLNTINVPTKEKRPRIKIDAINKMGWTVKTISGAILEDEKMIRKTGHVRLSGH
jgi:hypothetical protein